MRILAPIFTLLLLLVSNFSKADGVNPATTTASSGSQTPNVDSLNQQFEPLSKRAISAMGELNIRIGKLEVPTSAAVLNYNGDSCADFNQLLLDNQKILFEYSNKARAKTSGNEETLLGSLIRALVKRKEVADQILTSTSAFQGKYEEQTFLNLETAVRDTGITANSAMAQLDLKFDSAFSDHKKAVGNQSGVDGVLTWLDDRDNRLNELQNCINARKRDHDNNFNFQKTSLQNKQNGTFDQIVIEELSDKIIVLNKENGTFQETYLKGKSQIEAEEKRIADVRDQADHILSEVEPDLLSFKEKVKQSLNQAWEDTNKLGNDLSVTRLKYLKGDLTNQTGTIKLDAKVGNISGGAPNNVSVPGTSALKTVDLNVGGSVNSGFSPSVGSVPSTLPPPVPKTILQDTGDFQAMSTCSLRGGHWDYFAKKCIY